MAKNKWMKKMAKMEGVVEWEYDWFAPENVLKSSSPSLNWIYGKGSGLPFGYGTLLYGPPKSGKSLLSYLAVAGLHAQDPEAMAIKFNTEMREAGQMEDCWGIDPERYEAFDVNEPELIFDRIVKEIKPMLDEGMPLKLIIIDSLQGIMGVKAGNRDSVTNHLIGDDSKTVGDGLKAILSIVRRHKIALICTAQIRGNLDSGPKGPKVKMGGGFAQKHYFEYYMEVKRDGSAEGKVSATGEKFQGEFTDLRGQKEKTGHSIFVKNIDSSIGMGSGRSGRFTLDYKKGLINTEDEVFELAKKLGIYTLPKGPGTHTFDFGDKSFHGKPKAIQGLRDDSDMKKTIIQAIYDSNNPLEVKKEA